MSTEPTLTTRHEDGLDIPLLVWRLPEPLLAISTAPLGGGIGVRHWVVNATVPMSYRRDDPDVHLTELAAREGLDGPGIGLLTGVDVTEVVAAEDSGVRAWATVGIGDPILAAAPPAALAAPGPGTVNIVVRVPVRLSPAALVNAVATATEAKAQALWEFGLPATGTPTDAVSVLCPVGGPEAAYGGPRSEWGAPLARAVHAAVRTGGGTGRGSGIPWSDRIR